MSEIRKIKLPTISMDKENRPHEKSMYFDVDTLSKKSVRDWENNGISEPNRCALFGDIGEKPIVIGMDKELLLHKLQELKIIKIISLP
jgi:hypothetical protein